MYLDTKISLVCSHYNSFYIKTTEFSTCVWSLTHLSAVIADTFQDDSRLCSSTADQTLHLWPRKHWKPPQTPQELRTGRQMLFYVKPFLSFALRSFFWPSVFPCTCQPSNSVLSFTLLCHLRGQSLKFTGLAHVHHTERQMKIKLQTNLFFI